MLFEQCPTLYRDRYIDGIATEPSLAMLFGSAIHLALEALHQGHSGTCLEAACGGIEDHSARQYKTARTLYSARYAVMQSELAATGRGAADSLYAEGLRLIDLVAAMELNADRRSTPERWFSLPREATGWGLPTIGAVDLWSPPWSAHGPVVWDFKTTAGSWSDERVQRERWQPLLYSWAYQRAYGVVPTFRYLVLGRVSGTAELFDRTWPSLRAWRTELHRLSVSAEEIVESVANGYFQCDRGHGTCLECGEQFGHNHVCADASRHPMPRIALSGRYSTRRNEETSTAAAST